MINAIEDKTVTNEIIGLHNELNGFAMLCLEKAIRIGELLTEQKKRLGHGNYTGWVNANMPFSERTASNYMRLYIHRDKLQNTDNISDAYLILGRAKDEILSGAIFKADAMLKRTKTETLSDLTTTEDVEAEHQELIDMMADIMAWLDRTKDIKEIRNIHYAMQKVRQAMNEYQCRNQLLLGRALLKMQ